jgi:hypothetical protein
VLAQFTTDSGIPLNQVATSSQIYTGNKSIHFKAIRKIYPEIEYEDMIFYDNEVGNVRDVSAGVGVLSVHTPNGMTRWVWEEGLKLFRERKVE